MAAISTPTVIEVEVRVSSADVTPLQTHMACDLLQTAFNRQFFGRRRTRKTALQGTAVEWMSVGSPQLTSASACMIGASCEQLVCDPNRHLRHY